MQGSGDTELAKTVCAVEETTAPWGSGETNAEMFIHLFHVFVKYLLSAQRWMGNYKSVVGRGC